MSRKKSEKFCSEYLVHHVRAQTLRMEYRKLRALTLMYEVLTQLVKL